MRKSRFPSLVRINRPVVWITGASRGIGRELAREFAFIGCSVVLTARSREQLDSLRGEIAALGGEALSLPCDLTDTRAVFRTVAKIVRSKGRIDVLINNAGQTVFKSFSRTTPGEIERILGANLGGAVFAIKAALPHMLRKKEGWVFNILSTAALKPFPGSAAYSATKAGMRALGNVLREEVRSQRIRVTNVYPGPIDTAMWSQAERRKNRSRMMSARSVAQAIVAMYQMPQDVVVEEVLLRPILGDIDS